MKGSTANLLKTALAELNEAYDRWLAAQPASEPTEEPASERTEEQTEELTEEQTEEQELEPAA